jgi:RHS repeat-associated protein
LGLRLGLWAGVSCLSRPAEWLRSGGFWQALGIGAAGGAVAGAVGWLVPTLLPASGLWGSVGIGALTQTLAYTYTADGLRVAENAGGEAATFVWDLASPLAQVLATSDGARYVHGLDLVAERRSGVWAYPLGDALGSVRQWTDGDGYVDYAGGYTPFGTQMWTEGSTSSNWGYTGEWWDASMGMVYLRARWYALGTGRFTQRDSRPGDYYRGLNLNPYLYVLAAPTNHTDPSGHCPLSPYNTSCSSPDYRDLTDWLHREMVHNADSSLARELRMWNAIAMGDIGIGVVGCGVGWYGGLPVLEVGGGVLFVGGLVLHWHALVHRFRALVENEGPWDFKDEIGIRLGPGITLCSGGICWRDVEYSVPGNIHYGYIGKAAGVLGVELQLGAGWAEANDPAYDPDSDEYTGGSYDGSFPFPIPGPHPLDPGTWNFGDDPEDHEAVLLGLTLWRRYRGGLSRGELESELSGYIGRLARHAPRSTPVGPDDARYWPHYPVGYFNNRGRIYNTRYEYLFERGS